MADAVLRAVCADPGDTPRLASTDWLEEHGQEAEVDRACIIRADCGTSAGST
jgi:uncharacterized protein (TIGR02996 family)